MLAVVAATLILAAAPAAEANDPNAADLRCAAAFASMLGEAEAGSAVAVGGISAVWFYFGRIDARNPGFDLEGGLKRLLVRPDYASLYPADLQRCGAEMAARGARVEAIGKAIEQTARNGQQPG